MTPIVGSRPMPNAITIAPDANAAEASAFLDHDIDPAANPLPGFAPTLW